MVTPFKRRQQTKEDKNKKQKQLKTKRNKKKKKKTTANQIGNYTISNFTTDGIGKRVYILVASQVRSCND